MRPPSARRETVDFLSAVWALYRELHAASARMLEHLGVSGPQRLALRIIEINERITPGKLASAMDLHRSTVSGLIKRLEQLGLLRRTSDPTDHRMVFLELTAAGRKLNARALTTIEAALAKLLEARGPAWQKRASAILQDLSQAVHSAGDGRKR